MDYPLEINKEGIFMTYKQNTTGQDNPQKMLNVEEVVRELGKGKSIDDFYGGREGIFARLRCNIGP